MYDFPFLLPWYNIPSLDILVISSTLITPSACHVTLCWVSHPSQCGALVQTSFFPWFSPMAEIIWVYTVTSAEKCWRKRATETHTHIQEGGKSTKKANCLVVDMTVQSPRLSPPAVPKTVFALPSQWRRPQVPKLNVAFHLYALIFFFSQVYYFIMWTWSLNTSLHSSNLGDNLGTMDSYPSFDQTGFTYVCYVKDRKNLCLIKRIDRDSFKTKDMMSTIDLTWCDVQSFRFWSCLEKDKERKDFFFLFK